MTNMLFLLLVLLTIGIAGWSARLNPDGTQPSAVTEPQAAQSADTKAIPTANQRERFIAVDGPDLKSRLETAIKLGRSSTSSSKFWTAYSFDVRPGVAVDAEVIGNDGGRTFVQSANVGLGAPAETRNLGVFLLHQPGSNAIARIEVYNLERRHEYSGYPVYWLGRANNEESLNLLNDLIGSNQATKIAEHGVMALALHDDPRVGPMLENIVRISTLERSRATAVFWLGQIGGEQTFLANLVRSEQESVEVRKQGAFALGVGKDKDALATLEALYATVTPREVKRQIIFAASINQSKDAAVSFLIKLAGSDPDRELKKQAIFWLGQKAGQRSLDALGEALNSDPDTEVQKQAVFAISQRPKDEAVPLLIKIAKTHSKAEVRKQAMFWLGQTGDERALEFFKEVLLK
jgi:HEAT repeat protein